MSFKNKPSGSYYRKRSAQREADRQKEWGSLPKFFKVDRPVQPKQLDNAYEKSEIEKADISQVFDQETSYIDKAMQVQSEHQENTIKDIGPLPLPIKDSLRLQLVEQGVSELQNKTGAFVEDAD